MVCHNHIHVRWRGIHVAYILSFVTHTGGNCPYAREVTGTHGTPCHPTASHSIPPTPSSSSSTRIIHGHPWALMGANMGTIPSQSARHSHCSKCGLLRLYSVARGGMCSRLRYLWLVHKFNCVSMIWVDRAPSQRGRQPPSAVNSNVYRRGPARCWPIGCLPLVNIADSSFKLADVPARHSGGHSLGPSPRSGAS